MICDKERVLGPKVDSRWSDSGVLALHSYISAAPHSFTESAKELPNIPL